MNAAAAVRINVGTQLHGRRRRMSLPRTSTEVAEVLKGERSLYALAKWKLRVQAYQLQVNYSAFLQ